MVKKNNYLDNWTVVWEKIKRMKKRLRTLEYMNIIIYTMTIAKNYMKIDEQRIKNEKINKNWAYIDSSFCL